MIAVKQKADIWIGLEESLKGAKLFVHWYEKDTDGEFHLGMGDCYIRKNDVLAKINDWNGGIISPREMLVIKRIK